jgi:hypothetical protein
MDRLLASRDLSLRVAENLFCNLERLFLAPRAAVKDEDYSNG